MSPQFRPVLLLLLQLLLLHIASARHARIVGGSDAAAAEFPFAVTLTRRGGHFCGGTIVGPRWILTAAHCVCTGLGRLLRAEQLQAGVGQLVLSDYRPPRATTNHLLDLDDAAVGGRRLNLSSVHVHPEYACTRAAHDIALLQTAAPMRFTSTVRAARLPDERDRASPRASATVCGWGWTAEDHAAGDRADRLQRAEVEVWPRADCDRLYRQHGDGSRVEFGAGQMCAGRLEGGRDACWADSGGSLTREGRVIGVVSTGVGCGRRGLPGIYTEVAAYEGWIERVMQGQD